MSSSANYRARDISRDGSNPAMPALPACCAGRMLMHLIYTSACAARPAGYVWVYESKRTSTEFGSGARFDGLISDIGLISDF